MKKGDFIDLIARYGSFFVSQKGKHHKVITQFINWVAAENGVDYAMHHEELEKHRKRDIVPVDVDVMIHQSRQLEDCYSVLTNIYINVGKEYPQVLAEIENLADKQGGRLKERISLHKD